MNKYWTNNRSKAGVDPTHRPSFAGRFTGNVVCVSAAVSFVSRRAHSLPAQVSLPLSVDISNRNSRRIGRRSPATSVERRRCRHEPHEERLVHRCRFHRKPGVGGCLGASARCRRRADFTGNPVWVAVPTVWRRHDRGPRRGFTLDLREAFVPTPSTRLDYTVTNQIADVCDAQRNIPAVRTQRVSEGVD